MSEPTGAEIEAMDTPVVRTAGGLRTAVEYAGDPQRTAGALHAPVRR